MVQSQTLSTVQLHDFAKSATYLQFRLTVFTEVLFFILTRVLIIV